MDLRTQVKKATQQIIVDPRRQPLLHLVLLQFGEKPGVFLPVSQTGVTRELDLELNLDDSLNPSKYNNPDPKTCVVVIWWAKCRQ